MLHHLLLAMLKRGHEVEVFAYPHAKSGKFEGVPVHAEPDDTKLASLWEWCDVAVTHLDHTGAAIEQAIAHKRPLAHLVHNGSQLSYWNVSPFTCQMAIFNSQWLSAASRWYGSSAVVHPPVDPGRYRVKPGKSITLSNVSPEKGSEIFYSLAQQLPDHEFLGVEGVYGAQVRPRFDLPNVSMIPNQGDMRAVYRKTRLLLMPSSYESWGRCAMEAAVSGIPTIASPVEGLRGSLGSAGIFCPPKNAAAWEQAVRRLDDADAYAAASRAVSERAAALPPEPEYDAFEVALEKAIENGPAKQPPPKLWNGPQPRGHVQRRGRF